MRPSTDLASRNHAPAPTDGSRLPETKAEGTQKASEQISSFGDAVSDVVSDAGGAVSQAGAWVGEGLRGFAELQKSYGARGVEGVAEAAHQAADRLDDRAPSLAGVVRTAATRLETFSRDLERRNIDDVIASANSFARAEPAAFFGGSLLAGFVLSRFLKTGSSADDTDASDAQTRDWRHG